MYGTTQRQATQEQAHQTPWDDVHVATVPAAGWAVDRIEDGLRVLERIRREVDSACAALISAMPESRDAVTGLVRVTGVSAAARQQALRRLVLTAGPAGPAGPEGMVAIHGLLPPKQGALLEALLQTGDGRELAPGSPGAARHGGRA